MSAALFAASPVHWYIVRTHAHAERLAKYHLERQGFATYLPMIFNGESAKPLFQRYLFVSFAPEADRWRSIFSTIGVKQLLVSSTDKPLVVPDSVVDAITEAERMGLIRLDSELEELPCHHQKGDRVKIRIKDLPLEAVFQERLDGKRVAVLLDVLGRETRTVVHLAHLS